MSATHGILPQVIDASATNTAVAKKCKKHIVLDRQHTALLMATMTGGVAYRVAFSGAIADQFRRADGKIDICSMHKRAAADSRCKDQYPELRITLNKNLILPPAIQVYSEESTGHSTSKLA